MRPERRTARWLVLLAALLLPGCAALPDHRDAGEKPGRFQALEADPRVLHEPGAADFAARAAADLPEEFFRRLKENR
jgi:hypothetical protein